MFRRDLLARERVRQGRSISSLAQTAHMDSIRLERIESGLSPSRVEVMALAAALGVLAHDLDAEMED